MLRRENELPPLPPLPKPRYVVVKDGDVSIVTATDNSEWIPIQCMGIVSGWYGDFSSHPNTNPRSWARHVVFFPATNKFISPTMFERLGGKGSNHRWKISIGVLLPSGERGMDIGDWLELHNKSSFVPPRESPKKRRKVRDSPPPEEEEEEEEDGDDHDEQYNDDDEEEEHGSPSKRLSSRSRTLPTTPTTAIGLSLTVQLAIHSPPPQPTLPAAPGMPMMIPVEDHDCHRSGSTTGNGLTRSRGSGRRLNAVPLFQSEMLPQVQQVQQQEQQQLSIASLTGCPPPPYPYVLYGPTGTDLAFNGNLVAPTHVQNPLALTQEEEFAAVILAGNSTTAAAAQVETRLPIGDRLSAAAFLGDDLQRHGGLFHDDSSSGDLGLGFGHVPGPSILRLPHQDDDGIILNGGGGGGGGGGIGVPEPLHHNLPHLPHQDEFAGGSRGASDFWSGDENVESLSALLDGGDNADGERLSDGSSSYDNVGGAAFAPPSPGELIESPTKKRAPGTP